MMPPTRPGDDESRLSDAHLWEKKVREGMSEAQATAYVQARRHTPHGSTRSWEDPAELDRNTRAMKPMGIGAKIREGIGALAQGATFGWADELGAPLTAALSGESTDEARARLRAGQAQFHAQQPKTATALNMGGSMVVPGLGYAAGGLKGFLGGALLGAGSGALDAAGNAPEGQRESAATQGAVLGGAVAAAIPAFGVPLGRAVGRVAATDAAQAASRRLAASRAGRGIASMVRQAIPGLTPKERADEMLLNALERAGLTPADAVAKVQASRKPVGLLDVGGNEVQKVARGARTAGGGVARDLPAALAQRTEGQGARIADDLTRGTGLTRPDVEGTVEDLIRTRRQNAKPLYEAAYGANPVDDDAVREAFQLPAFQAAYRRAQRIAATEGVKLPAIGKDVALPVQAIDYTKRGLDDLIESKMRAGAMGRTEARALRERLNAVLERVDEIVPDYKAARAQFRGDTELKEAFELGADFLKMRPEQVKHALGKMTDGERAMFRRRAIDALLGKVDDVDDHLDVSKRIGASVTKRGRLKELFADEADFNAFKAALAEEADMFRAQHFITGGSNTADKLTELADLAGVDLGDLFQAATNPKSAMLRGASNLWQRAGQGYTRRVSDELAPSLTAGVDANPTAVMDVLQRLIENAEAIAAKRRLGAKSTRAAAQTAGGRSGTDR